VMSAVIVAETVWLNLNDLNMGNGYKKYGVAACFVN